MLFRSFIVGGFECATGYNARGDWIDQIAATHHDQHADADYARLAQVGIFAAREAIRWPLVDRGGGRYDFSSVDPFVTAARGHGVEVIWDLFHYGYPPGLDLFGEEFPARFADYCAAAARYVAARTEGRCFFTPVNEPSFFAWAAGEVGRFAPHRRGCAFELKVALARAALRGIDAIRRVVPQARIVNVDPLCHVAPPPDRPDLAEAVRHFNERAVWESFDIIAGRFMPELGGSRAHLDIVGLNYYWTNQWELGRDEQPLADDDPRRVPLSDLIVSVWERYGGAECVSLGGTDLASPGADRASGGGGDACTSAGGGDILLTETAHVDDTRPRWLAHIVAEAEKILARGIPLRGVCLYPILGMPEWHAPEEWVNMGLWDLRPCEKRGLTRELCTPMLPALEDALCLGERYWPAPTARPPLRTGSLD
ncbi:MAG: glycoside hydrolase [Opitutae bacterium]|nr:glycoside hydrolase [Opitutae bacterium]